MHLSLWMNVIQMYLFSFVMGLRRDVRNKTQPQKNRNENICLEWDSNKQPSTPNGGDLGHSAMLTGEELCLKVLQDHCI